MKLIVTANVMENRSFAAFVGDALRRYPGAAVLNCGDLLSVFPEPGEDLRASIFYEVYGELLCEGLATLHADQFASVRQSALLQPLRDLFAPGGKHYLRGLRIAAARYKRLMASLRPALRDAPLFFIPGNMDYDELLQACASTLQAPFKLDGDGVVRDGVRLCGVGAVPSNATPFDGLAPVGPYELSAAAYAHKLQRIGRTDVLITHQSPHECPALWRLVRAGSVRLVVCRAPFDLEQDASRYGNCRGLSRCMTLHDTMILHVRPFEAERNCAFVVDIRPGNGWPQVEVYDWRAAAQATVHAVSPVAPSRP